MQEMGCNELHTGRIEGQQQDAGHGVQRGSLLQLLYFQTHQLRVKGARLSILQVGVEFHPVQFHADVGGLHVLR